MLIPDDILQTLLCSECQRYLSVAPVKVYPNRYVKCGRCTHQEDHGVVSKLYEMVISDFEIPCVNRFAGCEQILSYKDVEEHELVCIVNEYECLFCNDFKGQSAYHLQLHLKKYHLSNGLRNMEALVELDEGNLQKNSWYCKENFLLILKIDYDFLEKKLRLDLSVFGDNEQHCVMQKFLLFTVKNELKENTGKVPCSTWNSLKQDGSFLFNINPKEYPKNIVICKFSVTEMAIKMPSSGSCNRLDHKNLPDRPGTSINITAVFTDISKIKKGGYQDFEPWFYVNNLKWTVYIMRSDDYFGIFLESLDVYKQSTPGLLKKITLVSTDDSKIKSTQNYLSKEETWERTYSGNTNFISRKELLDKSNGYIDENDSIKVQVFVKFDGKVQPASCKDCKIYQNSMVYCASCTNKLSK